MKDKSNVNYQYPTGGGGCGLGCLGIGCLGIVLVFAAVIVGGYFSLFHTSLPLRLMEATIENSGEVEIEGLDGSISSGFSADKFRFKTVDDNWSTLEGIKFEYENDSSFFGTDSLAIKEMSIESGVIYANWDPSKQQIDLNEIEGDLENIQGEIDEEEIDVEFIKALAELEIRLDKVSIANLKIVNPETEDELVIENVSYVGFNFNEGRFTDLGELEIRSNQLDVETVPSKTFVDYDNARRLEGTIFEVMDNRLSADIPFDIEYAIDDDFNGFTKINLFDGKIQIEDTADELSIEYKDFIADDYFDTSLIPVMPTNVEMSLNFEQGERAGPRDVSSDGRFTIGKTIFNNLSITENDNGRRDVAGKGVVSGDEVTIKFFVSSPYSVWGNIRLESASDVEPNQLWAQVLFGKDFEELDQQQSQIVDDMLGKKKPATEVRQEPVDESEDTESSESEASESDTQTELETGSLPPA